MNLASQPKLYLMVFAIVVCFLQVPPSAMASNSAGRGDVIAWEQLSDPYGVRKRVLNNQMVFAISGNRYIVKSPQGDGWMTRAPGTYGGTTITSRGGKPPEVKPLLGGFEDETPDPMLYSVLGVGSSLVLPDDWIKIFGVRLRNGTIFIQKSGLQLNGVDLGE